MIHYGVIERGVREISLRHKHWDIKFGLCRGVLGGEKHQEFYSCLTQGQGLEVEGVLVVELLPLLYYQGMEGKETSDLFPSLKNKELNWGLGAILGDHFHQ